MSNKNKEISNKLVPWKIVWVERHQGVASDIGHIHEQKPDWSNDAVHSRATVQRVRIWFEPLGKEKLAKVWKEI